MNWNWKGTAWVFGDEIPNDEGLMPLKLTRAQEYNPEVLKKHCFEQVMPDFAARAKAGDFVVGGRNFAFGNPHIQGFLGLKGLGVGLLADSMQRGALRACVNAGVPVLLIPGITGFARPGDVLAVNFEAGVLRNETTGKDLTCEPLPDVMREIIGCGGGIEHMKMKLGVKAA